MERGRFGLAVRCVKAPSPSWLTLGHSSGTSKVAVPRSSCSASGEKAAAVASSLLRRSVWRDVLRL